jgi:hypothetical protein
MASKVRTLSERMHSPYSIGLSELNFHRFDPHERCPACMMGKSRLNNIPKRKDRSNSPLARVQMHIFQSSVMSVEGHMYALVITDDCTGYRRLYGLITKDYIFKAIRKWYSDIAELREMHNLLVVMPQCGTMLEKIGPGKSLSFSSQGKS